MKNTYMIIAAIVVIAVIIGSVFAYTYLSSPAAQSTPTPTPNPTNRPSTSPTMAPSTTPHPSSTTGPTVTAAPTTTAAPTASPSPTPVPTPGPASITASGATFPQPFLTAAIAGWQQVRTNVQINYGGGGSGKGVTDLTNKLVDFACSDAALTPAQTTALPSQAVTIPETIGAITVAYNLPGVTSGLKLTGPIIANMYLGTITNWNDAQITAINPGINLPNQPIVLVRRGESSGTTSWFTKYLCLSSQTWLNQVGNGSAVQWPGTTVGQTGNNGVAGYIEGTPYSIGYVELAYALTYNMKVAAVQNPAGNYVTPSLQTTINAAASLPTTGLPAGTGDWSQITILNAPGAQAYPIANPTFTFVYQNLGVVPGMTLDKATQIVQFLWYITHDGQTYATQNSYAALPANIVTLDETTISSINLNGQALVTH